MEIGSKLYRQIFNDLDDKYDAVTDAYEDLWMVRKAHGIDSGTFMASVIALYTRLADYHDSFTCYEKLFTSLFADSDLGPVAIRKTAKDEHYLYFEGEDKEGSYE